MRRFAIACIVALAAGLSASASARTQAAHLRGFVCQQALDPAARAVSVSAVMQTLPGTQKLAMRFELLRRTRRKGRPVSLSGRKLKTWITPRPSSSSPALGSRPGDRWIVKHPVVDLAGPFYYQFRVTFRWTGANDQPIARAVRTSPICFQPEPRADLRVQDVKVTPVSGQPGVDQYVAEIINAGRTASGRFDVEFSDGATDQTTTVPQLLARRATRVTFEAAACSAAAPATITADPTGMVDDADPSNNSMTVSCD
jgi:hypothetical protein